MLSCRRIYVTLAVLNRPLSFSGVSLLLISFHARSPDRHGCVMMTVYALCSPPKNPRRLYSHASRRIVAFTRFGLVISCEIAYGASPLLAPVRASHPHLWVAVLWVVNSGRIFVASCCHLVRPDLDAAPRLGSSGATPRGRELRRVRARPRCRRAARACRRHHRRR